jgi:receptor protein-tyrosine kinase
MVVTDEIPRRAARVANTFAAEYVAFRRAATREIYTQALARVRRKQAQLSRSTRGRVASRSEVAQARRLRSQANELDLLASVQTGGAQVVQRARVPSSPVSPKPSRNYLLGGFIGLLLGFALATMRDKLDRRIKNKDQIRELAPEFPILAELPRTSGSDKAAPFYAEGIRTLQTNVTFLNHDGSLKSLLITSPSVAEGKSTTSLNLALAIAEQGEDDVILVDADLRRPGLSDALKLSRRMGVSNFLSGHGGTVQDYVHNVTIDRAQMNGKGPAAALSGSLRVVPAGPTPPNPHALLNASTLESFMAQARTFADRVVIDGAPLGPTSDMLPVAKRVDGVLLVVRLYSSRRDELERLVAQLRQAGVTPLGIVVAGSTPRKRDAYYARQ